MTWKEQLDRYLAYSQGFDLPSCPPATDEDVARLRGSAKALNLDIDADAVEFLRVTNGTSFDALRVYGANIENDDEYGRFDFARANTLIEERGADTIYGEWQDDFLVKDRSTGTFERRSKVTSDVYETYGSWSEMITAVLSQECELLRERYGRPGEAP